MHQRPFSDSFYLYFNINKCWSVSLKYANMREWESQRSVTHSCDLLMVQHRLVHLPPPRPASTTGSKDSWNWQFQIFFFFHVVRTHLETQVYSNTCAGRRFFTLRLDSRRVDKHRSSGIYIGRTINIARETRQTKTKYRCAWLTREVITFCHTSVNQPAARP